MSREERKYNLVKCSNKIREDRKMTGKQKKDTKERERRNEWILDKNMYLSVEKHSSICQSIYSCSP